MGKPHPLLLVVLVGWCLGASLARPAHAQLVWAANRAEATVEPDATERVASFRIEFRNGGTSTVNVTSVTSSCKCSQAKTDQTAYAPGEKGVLTATMDVTGKVGSHEKEITVGTDAPLAPPIKLSLKAIIQPRVEVVPAEVDWTRARPRRPNRSA